MYLLEDTISLSTRCGVNKSYTVRIVSMCMLMYKKNVNWLTKKESSKIDNLCIWRGQAVKTFKKISKRVSAL